jgi:hypothetical protein
MKRSRLVNTNQLQIDFLSSYRQMLISLGQPAQLPLNEGLFVRLTDHWDRQGQLPPDVLFQKSPVEAVVFRLRKAEANPGRLQFPTQIVAGEVRGIPGLTGFAATFREQGWLVLPAELSPTYKNLFLNILTAAIGLADRYPNRAELLAEAERTALAALLPEAEIRKFFGIKLSRFPDSFRAEVSTYFNLPFESILKRANQIGAVSDTILDDATSVKPPLRATSLRKSASSQAA